MHTADVKTVLRVYSLEVAAAKTEDLNEEPIIVRLRKVRSRSHCDSSSILIYANFIFRLVGRVTMAFDLPSYNFRSRMTVVFLGFLLLQSQIPCHTS